MKDAQTLIPSPAVVRERLAEHIEEGKLLRSLYRLSIRAALERERANRIGNSGRGAVQQREPAQAVAS